MRVEQAPDCDGGVRYFPFDSVRAFGQAKLREAGREAVVRRLHADFFAALALRGAIEGEGERLLGWVSRLQHEEENLRAVVLAGVADEALAPAAVGAMTGLLWLLIGRAPLKASVQLFVPRCWIAAAPTFATQVPLGIFSTTGGKLACLRGRHQAGVRFSSEAVVQARASGNEKLLARALIRRARMGRLAGQADDEIDGYLNEAVSIAAPIGDNIGLLLAQFARLTEDASTPNEQASFYEELVERAETDERPVPLGARIHPCGDRMWCARSLRRSDTLARARRRFSGRYVRRPPVRGRLWSSSSGPVWSSMPAATWTPRASN